MAPLGRTPSSSCRGGYACNGTSASCATACNSDAGCVEARCGAGAACIQKLALLKEDFNSAAFDASTWFATDPDCSVVNQQFQVNTTPGTTNYSQIASRRRYDLLDSELKLELISAGNQSLSTMQALAGGCDFATDTRCAYMVVSGGAVSIQLADNGVYTVPGGYFLLAAFRSLRMREDGGTLFLEGRNVDAGWQTLGSSATPFGSQLNDLNITVGAGTYAAEASQTTVIWDNINTP